MVVPLASSLAVKLCHRRVGRLANPNHRCASARRLTDAQVGEATWVVGSK